MGVIMVSVDIGRMAMFTIRHLNSDGVLEDLQGSAVMMSIVMSMVIV